MKTVTLRCIFCLEPNPVNLNEGCDERLCTKCSKPFLMDRPFRINQEDFKMTVLDSKLPVLVDFYADWCGPCKMVNPIIDDIARLRQRPNVRNRSYERANLDTFYEWDRGFQERWFGATKDQGNGRECN